jgi:hypothetical protein
MLGYQAWAMTILQIGHKEWLEPMVLVFFAMAKFVLIFYVLVPAIAIRWTVCALEKKPPTFDPQVCCLCCLPCSASSRIRYTLLASAGTRLGIPLDCLNVDLS